MILIDYSQTIISALMAEIGSRNDVPIEVNLLRHMVINNIRSFKQKFGREYGEVVIACDSKKYWRKQIFPYYKGNRKKAREDSGFNWVLIFDTINLLKQELYETFPYKVIEVEGAEADDIIATLVEWSTVNDVQEHTMFSEPNPLLIISGDHDFIQLQRYNHVKQFSPVQKKFVKADTTPQRYVLEHILKGDKGDGVPNVLSGDNSIVDGERQKPLSSKKIEQWLEDPTTMPTEEWFRRNYDRNKRLVDLTCIPLELKENIINTFVDYPINNKSKILDYFITHRMKMMMEHLNEF